MIKFIRASFFSLFLIICSKGIVIGQVGVGTTTPASSSILDLTTTSKGMLIPRISLSSTTDVTTIASPATSLMVYNTNASMTNGSVGFWYYNGSAWVKFEIINKNWSLTGNAGTTASTAAIGSTVNNNFIGNTDAKDLVLATNNLERMRITSGGNLGVGTITPTNILSFSGQAARTIWMERNTTAATAGNNLTLQSGGAVSGGTNLAGGDLILSSGTSTGNNTSKITFNTATAGASGTADNAPSTKMTILGSGNVGIGTTTPGQKLETMNGNIFINNNNNTAGELQFAEPSTSGSNYVALKAGVLAGNTTYTLPTADGTNGQVLKTNGSGNLTWGSSSPTHLSGGLANVTWTAGPGAGTGPTITVTGNDIGGKISVTTGVAPLGNATIITINFIAPFTRTPFVNITPGNLNTAALTSNINKNAWVNSLSVNSFSIDVASTALGAPATFIWYYMVAE